MKRKRIFALFVLLCIFLSACRSSPVLVEEIYLQSAQETDPEQNRLEPQNDGVEDESFQNEMRDDLDTERDVEPDEGIDGELDEAEHAVEVEYNDTNLESYDIAEKVSEDAENDDAAADNNDARNTEPEHPTEVNGTEPAEDETDPTGGENHEAEGDNPTDQAQGEGTYRQIVDAAGEYVEIPANVTSCTAVGVAAQMVAMLGEPGVLRGTDESFLSSDIAGCIGVTAKLWWSGDGSKGMSDDCFAALLAEKPQVCFSISGANNFSEDQMQQLRDAEIVPVTLYDLSSVENLQYNARIIGQALNNEEKANAYIRWVDSLLSEAGNATASYADAYITGLYLCAWDYSATYEIAAAGFLESSGSGLAVAYSPAKMQLISSYMNAANVANQSTEDAGLHRSKDYVYVAPMFHNLSVTVSGEMAAYYTGEYGAAYDLFVSRRIGSTYYQLGCSAYQSVIVAEESIKKEIESNWYWQPHETNERGYVEINGQEFYCGVIGTYSIYVNPQGQFGCSWADASVESPLEACWVAAKVLGVYSMEDVKSRTVSFFQQFYDFTLSNDMLYNIFGE